MKLTKTLMALAIAALLLTWGVAPGVCAEIAVDGDVALTTGSLSNSAFNTFYAPAGTVTLRALDDGSATATLCYVKWFAAEPSSGDLDASTREKTGVALQEGDTLTWTTESKGWFGVDAATGTSKVHAFWRR